jgi:hypothetical protein
MVRAASVPIPKFARPCNTLLCELRNQTLTCTPPSTSCSTTFKCLGGGFRAGMMGGGLRGGIVGGGFRSATVAGGFRRVSMRGGFVGSRSFALRPGFAPSFARFNRLGSSPLRLRGGAIRGRGLPLWRLVLDLATNHPWGWQRLWACEAGLKCLGRKLREEGRLLYHSRVGIYVGRPCNSAPACSRLA